jgi:hypothetical protein
MPDSVRAAAHGPSTHVDEPYRRSPGRSPESRIALPRKGVLECARNLLCAVGRRHGQTSRRSHVSSVRRQLAALRSSILPRVAGVAVLIAAATASHAAPYDLSLVRQTSTSNIVSFSMNNTGEVLWTEGGNSASTWEIYSSTRGRLTNDSVASYDAHANDSGTTVWQQQTASGGWAVVKNGVVLSNSGFYNTGPRINNAGEVVWTSDGKIVSSTRGVLSNSGSQSTGPDINASGEVAYRVGGGAASMITTTVKGALGNGDHASINDSGEVVWTGIDATGMPVGIFSSVHGLIAAGGYYPSINNAGQIVYTRYNGSINELFLWDNGVSTLVSAGLNVQAFPIINDSGDIAFSTFSYNPTAQIGTYSLYLASYGASVPEPAGIALLGLAMLAAGAVVRRRR